VLVGLPELNRQIIRAVLRADPEVEITAEYDASIDLIEAVGRHDADVLIAGVGEIGADVAVALLSRRPRVKALALADDGSRGLLYELRPHRTVLGQLSAAVLLEAVQSTDARWTF
jgi:DNA-binding NarL/FixJ family response regulator